MKRKTSITKIASILTVLAMVWGGVACQPEAPVEPTKYTISFDSGIESITVEDGAVATEPTTAPEKTGYTFGGWLNGEAAYDWTQPVTSNLSLTAKWTAVEYTITYLPEGVETDNPPTYTIETETFELKAPTKAPDETKQKFVAWHVDSEEGAVVTEIAKGSTGNKTFYAEFSAEEPCVVKIMSGTEEVKSINVKKDTKITLPTGFEKYSLFSDADCTKAFDTTTAITADTTIYVKLKTFIISYKVLPFDKVNPVEGETNGSMPVEYGKVFTDEEINAFAEEINGYTYKGIFTDEACTVPFDNTNAITSDLTVYVLYAEEPCVVKFMSGTEEVKSINVKKDTKITLPTGFEKYSLFSDADCTKAFDTTTAITADTTIYVKLKTFIISYKVLPFDKVNPVEGETNGSMPVEYGKVFTDEEINAFAEEIDGYTYKGVFTDEACTVLFDNTNAITSDLTVYVLYEEVVEEETLFEVDLSLGTMGWSYNATYDAESKTITLTGDYGQGSTGWNDGVNWSAYKSLNVDISEYSNDWGKIVIQDMAGDPIKELEFNTVSEVISMDLTDVDVSAVKQFSIQGKASGDTIVVDRVYFLQIPNVEVEMSLGTMGWSYNATYDAESKTITLTGDYGQGSTGWNDGVNWSAYKSLNVDISEYSNDWGKIVIQDMAGDPIKELEFNTVSEVISMDLTDVDVSAVKQFSIQGKASGDTIVVDRVYFITK